MPGSSIVDYNQYKAEKLAFFVLPGSSAMSEGIILAAILGLMFGYLLR